MTGLKIIVSFRQRWVYELKMWTENKGFVFDAYFCWFAFRCFYKKSCGSFIEYIGHHNLFYFMLNTLLILVTRNSCIKLIIRKIWITVRWKSIAVLYIVEQPRFIVLMGIQDFNKLLLRILLNWQLQEDAIYVLGVKTKLLKMYWT